jgi:Uncharacterised nucleotidyltransferase
MLFALLRGAPLAPLSPEASARRHDLASHNRLDALLYDAGGSDDVPGARAEFRRRVLKAGRQLAAGVRLVDALRGAGIPCLALRGPFHGAWLHGNPALRPGKDIDLLVPRARARAALAVAKDLGYSHAKPGMPEGFFLRHHLHWQIRNEAEGSLCDLHWAVEHPYRLYAIGYDALFASAETGAHDGMAWSRPCARHALLLDLLHLHKHMESVPGKWTAERVTHAGEALHLLDAALLARGRGGELDWDGFIREGLGWRIGDAIALGLALLAEERLAPIPDRVLRAFPIPPAQNRRFSTPRWWGGVAARGGFRPDQWGAATRYC